MEAARSEQNVGILVRRAPTELGCFGSLAIAVEWILSGLSYTVPRLHRYIKSGYLESHDGRVLIGPGVRSALPSGAPHPPCYVTMQSITLSDPKPAFCLSRLFPLLPDSLLSWIDSHGNEEL